MLYRIRFLDAMSHHADSLAEGCGMAILAFTGAAVSDATADVSAGPTTPGMPAIGPQSFLSLGGILYWLVLGGGAVWAIKQIGELCKTIVFSVRSGWRQAEAGTDHERWATCEQQRMLDAQVITSLRDQLNTANALVGEKDKQIGSLTAHVRERDAWNRELTLNVAAQNKVLIETQALVASRSADGRGSSDVIPVTIAPGSSPVPVHEVGENGGGR